MAQKSNNSLAWGITLIVFGVLFLIRQCHFLPADISYYVFDYKNFPVIMGIIFLIFHSNKNIGWVLIIVGVLFRLNDIIRITRSISDFVWPVLIIIAGVIIAFGVGRKK
ncbi:MAG: hypothetical protein LBV75_03475 [Paludibacter sp.]|jgi:hypothetical protein|nr:hypothetical protein [Paludibacter sp.]